MPTLKKDTHNYFLGVKNTRPRLSRHNTGHIIGSPFFLDPEPTLDSFNGSAPKARCAPGSNS